MTTYSSILAGKIPWTEEPAEVTRVHGVTESDTTEHTHTPPFPKHRPALDYKAMRRGSNRLLWGVGVAGGGHNVLLVTCSTRCLAQIFNMKFEWITDREPDPHESHLRLKFNQFNMIASSYRINDLHRYTLSDRIPIAFWTTAYFYSNQSERAGSRQEEKFYRQVKDRSSCPYRGPRLLIARDSPTIQHLPTQLLLSICEIPKKTQSKCHNVLIWKQQNRLLK